MNPSKNNLFYIQRDLHSKYFKLISNFDRIEQGKFIEDNKELSTIGNEMFDSFFNYKNIKKISLFVDICAAPGNYSKLLQNRFEDSYGVGISLPIEKGGVKFEIDSKKYKIFMIDILEKDYKIQVPKKIDFGMASCVSYVHDKKSAAKLNILLILTSLNLILKNLKKDGNLIINLTFKNINLLYNILEVLILYFNDFHLWKSDKVWGTKNTFYFFGYGFKDNYDDKLIIIRKDIDSDINKFSEKFYGNKDIYFKITKKLNNIFITKINSILKILS